VKITIKQVQGTLLSNLFVIGLVACSSSPSPWSQAADSSWKAKRNADAPIEKFVAVPIEEPAMAEPEPVPVIAEPMAIQQPEPMPEPVPVAGERAGMSIMSMPASGFAVQVYAGKTQESVGRYQNAHGLEDLMIVKTERDGAVLYVLLSVYDDRAGANQAASELAQKTGSKPWVRSVAGLQEIAVE